MGPNLTKEKREAIITSIIAEKCKKLKADYLNLMEDLQAFSPETMKQIKDLIFGSSTTDEEILSLKLGNNLSIFTKMRTENLNNCRFENDFQAFFKRSYANDYCIAFSKDKNNVCLFKVTGRILLEETSSEYHKHLLKQLTAKKIENAYTTNLGFIGIFDSVEDCFTEHATKEQIEKRLYSLLKEDTTFQSVLNNGENAYIIEIGYNISKYPTEKKVPIVLVITSSRIMLADKSADGTLRNFRNEKVFETDFIKELLESFETFKEIEKIGNDAMIDLSFTA